MDRETERNGVAEKVVEEGKGKGSDEVLPEKKSKFPNRQIRKMPLLLATLYYDTEQVTPPSGCLHGRGEQRGAPLLGAATHAGAAKFSVVCE